MKSYQFLQTTQGSTLVYIHYWQEREDLHCSTVWRNRKPRIYVIFPYGGQTHDSTNACRTIENTFVNQLRPSIEISSGTSQRETRELHRYILYAFFFSSILYSHANASSVFRLSLRSQGEPDSEGSRSESDNGRETERGEGGGRGLDEGSTICMYSCDWSMNVRE